MLDIQRVVRSILEAVSEPINRLAARVKDVEDRKLPDEKQIFDAVMWRIDPVLADLGKRLEEMRNAFLVDVKAVRDAVADLPDENPQLEQLKETIYRMEEMVLAQDELIKGLKIEILPELPDIPAMIKEAVDAIPKAKDGEPGKSVTVEEITPVLSQLIVQAISTVRLSLEEQVQKAIDNIPQVKDGEPGKSVTVEEVTPVIEQFVRRVTDPIPVMITERIAEEIEALPKAKDGKDGIGLAGAVIDRNNHLVITLTDGTPRDLGPVVGKDADMKALTETLRQLVDEIPKPRDGFGFEDLSVEYDGRRSFALKFARGADSEEFKFKLPIMIYDKVYQPGRTYEVGDVVTWAGSMWHCDKDTDTKPGEANDNWTLAVKRGRNAKEIVSSEPKKSPIVKV